MDCASGSIKCRSKQVWAVNYLALKDKCGMIWKRYSRHKPSRGLLNVFSCPNWPPKWPEIEAEIAESIRSGDWGSYQSVAHERLTAEIAGIAGVKHARLVGSGSAAIEMALRALGIGKGDEVIVSAFDYPGNFRCIEAVGAIPVLADVEFGSVSIDPAAVMQAGGESTKAVIASHLYANHAPIRQLRELCDGQKWFLIEDACQNPGTVVDGRPVGGWGDIGCFSFGGTKALTAGNGGALLTDNDRHRARWSSLLDRPSDTQPLSALQCAALIPQITRLRESNEIRARAASHLLDLSKDWDDWQPIQNADFSAEHGADQTIYKLAWRVPTIEHRDHVVKLANDLDVPIGTAFRSMHRSSNARCRKRVPLDNSAAISDTTFVLAHHALLLDGDNIESLAHAMTVLHDKIIRG